MIKQLRLAGIIALFIGSAVACKKSESSSGTARVSVHLTDAPAPYDKVNVDVQKVEIHSDQSGWVTLDLIHPGVYNLLDFRNGLDTLLCQSDLPSGRISQMRLVLGSNNSVVVDGAEYALATPSAEQSGLKFNIQQELAANGSYNIWIDFDAAKSVVKKGNGSYSLKPVVRAYTELTNGRIKGIVLPLTAGATVYAINGTDTLSAIPDVAGRYMFSGLAEGNYSVTIDAAATSGLSDSSISNVSVKYGGITDLGITTLIP
jgi:hypothetical protein